MLSILSNTQIFQGVDAVFIKKYAVFSGRSMLLISRNRQYFRGVDATYIKQYVVFSRGRCCFYLAIRSIFEGSMLLLLSNAQFFKVSMLLIL